MINSYRKQEPTLDSVVEYLENHPACLDRVSNLVSKLKKRAPIRLNEGAVFESEHCISRWNKESLNILIIIDDPVKHAIVCPFGDFVITNELSTMTINFNNGIKGTFVKRDKRYVIEIDGFEDKDFPMIIAIQLNFSDKR